MERNEGAKAISRQGVVRGRGIKVIQTTVEPLIEATKRGQLFVSMTDPSRESRVQMWIEAYAHTSTHSACKYARALYIRIVDQRAFYPDYANSFPDIRVEKSSWKYSIGNDNNPAEELVYTCFSRSLFFALSIPIRENGRSVGRVSRVRFTSRPVDFSIPPIDK